MAGWADRAACKGEDLVLFFGPDGERKLEKQAREKVAKKICDACPVQVDCLDFAVGRPEKYGFYGGLNEEDRASLRRRRQRKALAEAS